MSLARSRDFSISENNVIVPSSAVDLVLWLYWQASLLGVLTAMSRGGGGCSGPRPVLGAGLGLGLGLGFGGALKLLTNTGARLSCVFFPAKVTIRLVSRARSIDISKLK